MNETRLLRVEELTVRYGGLAAVDRVSLDVEEGTIVGLIGPNGAGKTSFIDALTGFTPSVGSIRFDDEPVETL
ncbi:MAG: ATP-binding cassette domain-containing protein, partial [Acidimicrobiia bacterium]